MTYFKEKNVHLSEGPFFKSFNRKTKKKIEMPQSKEKCLFKNNLKYLLPIQNYMKHINFQTFCQNHWTLVWCGLLKKLENSLQIQG
jgi:hypothetical protein